MRIKCRGIEFRIRWNFCNFFACSSVRVDKVSLAFAILNILLEIAIIISIFYGRKRELFFIGLGSSTVNAIASALVIYGYFKRNPGFYLPYIMNNAIISAVMCLYIVAWYLRSGSKENDYRLLITIQFVRTLFSEKTLPDNMFNLGLVTVLHLFVLLSYPIYWSAYKSLNDDLQKRLNSIKETGPDPDSTRQQGQQLMPQQPTTLDIPTVESASHAEVPCPVPIVQHFYGTNTSAAERASLHDSMADYKVI